MENTQEAYQKHISHCKLSRVCSLTKYHCYSGAKTSIYWGIFTIAYVNEIFQCEKVNIGHSILLQRVNNY